MRTNKPFIAEYFCDNKNPFELKSELTSRNLVDQRDMLVTGSRAVYLAQYRALLYTELHPPPGSPQCHPPPRAPNFVPFSPNPQPHLFSHETKYRDSAIIIGGEYVLDVTN